MRHTAAILLVLTCATSLFAKNGAFRSTKHGDPETGPQRRPDAARGSCIQCHDGLHAGHNGAVTNDSAGLFAPNDNDFCITCHAAPSAAAIFPGSAVWSQTIHARSPNVYLPGPGGRPSSDANKCVNCHNPHGVRDGNGVIPAMLVERDADLCLTCHNGSRAKDISREFSKTYRHPVGTRTRHVPGESLPAAFAAIPGNNRHSECSDCHNAHSIDVNPAPPSPPLASIRLAGVSRVQVANGGAGLAPSYMWRGPEDPGANEYEICFKCHSSYTTQPPGQANLALITNPANPSYHPIQARGKNPAINPASFVDGYDAQSMIFCSDCHTSDDSTIRGPHGSSWPYLLKKRSMTSVGQLSMDASDICFDCHAYATYADRRSAATVQQYSRFNSDNHGHTYHVGNRQLTCYSCHESHGSTRDAALIARRAGAITSYSQTSTGGSCNSFCHGSKTYVAGYAR